MVQNKTVKLISPRGFCFGVTGALKIVEDAISKYSDKQIFVINEIVHNKTIIKDLEKRGVRFIQDYKALPDGSIVIFSAHGVSPQIRDYFQQKKVILLDATCYKVQSVHVEVNRLVDNGYHIIYIGSRVHDEGRGVIAEAPDSISVIETVEDISRIPKDRQHYAILTQTTLNLYEVEFLYQEIKKVFPKVEFPKKNDLCKATTERQVAIREASIDCDLVLVLGSANSSNSKRLQEISLREGVKSFLIDDYRDLEPTWLQDANHICITSGASAPEYLVEQLVKIVTKEYRFKLIT